MLVGSSCERVRGGAYTARGRCRLAGAATAVRPSCRQCRRLFAAKTVALQLWTALHARPHAAATIDSEPGAASAVARSSDRGEAGCEAAARFRALMLPHLDAAYNLARFLCRDPDAAEDVVQEAFLRAYRSFATFRGGSPRAWILSIVRNCHRDWWSDRRRRQAMELVRDADEAGAEGQTRRGTTRRRRRISCADRRQRRCDGISVRCRSRSARFSSCASSKSSPTAKSRRSRRHPSGTVMSRLARARKLFATAWTGRTEAEEDAR